MLVSKIWARLSRFSRCEAIQMVPSAPCRSEGLGHELQGPCAPPPPPLPNGQPARRAHNKVQGSLRSLLGLAFFDRSWVA